MDNMKMIRIVDLVPSSTNPRKTFNQKSMDELIQSVKEKGVIQPILVRMILQRNNKPAGEGLCEVVTGERRYRAAQAAGLTEIPAMIKELSDQDALEIQVIENLHREDVHPLEEAEGYAVLMRRPGVTAAKIAEKIGQSEKYVYDRIKLLSLTPKAKEYFLAGKFTAGHAIILARLTPSQQALCMEPQQGGLFDHEYAGHLYDDKKEKGDPVKPKSVRELQVWVDDHVRFEAHKVDQMIFPETAKILGEVKEKAEKIVSITEDFYVQTSARTDERVIGPRSWTRADGKAGSKTCEHSVTGVFVVGPGRGNAMKVCIAKEKCKVHWGSWQKERAARSQGDTSSAKTHKEDQLKQEQALKEEQAKSVLWKKRFDKALPQVLQALKKHLLNLPCDAKGPYGKLIMAWLDDNCLTPDKNCLPLGTSAEDMVRCIASMILVDRLDSQYKAPDADDLMLFKPFGFDVIKMVNELVPENKVETKKGAKK